MWHLGLALICRRPTGVCLMLACRLIVTNGLDRTAAIRHHNGSFTNVAKVELDSEYKEMMRRLSLEFSKHSR